MTLQRGFKGNVLLIELLIVILFFSVSAAIDLELFGAAHEDGKKSRALSEAVIDCQDWAEGIYAARDPGAMLLEAGWTSGADGAYELEKERYTLSAQLKSEQAGRGSLLRGSLRAFSGDEVILELPLAKYLFEGEAAA